MKTLQQRLGLGSVVAISMSAMLGSGIFVLPGLAIEHAGAYAWLAYLLAAISVLPASMSKSELATAMPTSGGTYVYLERTFGPLAGTVSGFGLWLSLLLKCAFALVGFGAYLSIFAEVPLIPTALCLLVGITLMNIFGVGKVSSALKVIVSITVIGLGILVCFGLYNLNPELVATSAFPSTAGLISSTALVFVSYAGVTKVAAIAEEVKDPEKNLPKGILISLFAVTMIYCLVNFVLTANVTPETYIGDLRPIYTVTEKLAGPVFGIFASILGVLTMTSMANAGILAASRFPFAMSRDHLLPSKIGSLSPKYLTPVISILISGLIVGLSIVTLNVEKIAKFASAFMILIYMSESLAVIVLRESRVAWYRPSFKSPLYPWLQIFGIISGAYLLFAMGILVFKAVASISLPAIIIYFLYSRKRAPRLGVIGIRGKRKDLVEDTTVTYPFVNMASMEIAGDASVVTILFGKERSPEMLVEMSVSLLEQKRNLEVAHLTEVPEQTDLLDLKDDSSEIRSLRRRIGVMKDKLEKPITFDSVASHDIYKTVYDIGLRFHCEWLVTEWGGRTRGAFTFHNPMGWVRDHLSSHLMTFRDAGVRYIQKIKLVIDFRDMDEFLVHTADHIASHYDADLTFVTVAKDTCTQEQKENLFNKLTSLRKHAQTETDVLILQGKDKVQTLIDASNEFDLLIFGVSRNEFHHMTIRETVHDKLMSKSACSVMSIQPSRETFVNGVGS